MRKRTRRRQKRLLWALAVAAVLAAPSAWLALAAPAVSPASSPVTYPVLYSDTHITRNAIEADPRFRHVAVASRQSIAAGILLSFSASRNLAPAPARREDGTWLWTPTLQLTPEYMDAMLDGAVRHGIRNIYLSLDSYLDIFVMAEGPEKEAKRRQFDATVERFLAKAHARGLTVDAEGGWRNWAEVGHVYKPLALVEYVKAYNAAHAEKFRGLQYDIEPYLLDEYHEDKKEVLGNFLDLVYETVSRLHNTDLAFSVVIPDFYDGSAGETPELFYSMRYGYVLDHLFSILDRRTGSSVIVMAYRNESEGTDGSIAISEKEVEAAGRFKSRVIIAQETGEVTPASLTFYGSSRAHLDTHLEKIDAAFEKRGGYSGIAIHYLNALLALR